MISRRRAAADFTHFIVSFLSSHKQQKTNAETHYQILSEPHLLFQYKAGLTIISMSEAVGWTALLKAL